ncbi:MAG: trypsin-like peptidase domain-containing protein, partial [Stackebrandtia sp.]
MGDEPIPVSRGVVPGHVAEIIVGLDREPGRRGSGYRVGPTSVLTAAHVIEGAVAVRVRFDADLPGEWTAEAISCWADPRSDLAVLSITPREGEPMVPAARFGRIGGGGAAVLAARAVGFPLGSYPVPDAGSHPWLWSGECRLSPPCGCGPGPGRRRESPGPPGGGRSERWSRCWRGRPWDAGKSPI